MATTSMDALIGSVVHGFRADEHVRVRVPGGGTLNIDRKLPFLFVVRQPPDAGDDHAARLVLGEASWLITNGAKHEDAAAIVRALAQAGSTEFGSFLVLELWPGPAGSQRFVIQAPAGPAAPFVDALQTELGRLQAGPRAVSTILEHTDERHPHELPPLLSARECWQIGCLLVGLEVPPLHQEDGVTYPVYARRLRARLSPVLRQTAFEFARVQTTVGVEDYRTLGPRRFDDTLFEIDRELAAIQGSYDLLLLVSPVNVNAAWRTFRDSRFSRVPEFKYRLLPMDPDVIKRRLYSLDLDHVADPALSFLLRDKRDELDRQVTMLAERNTPDFRFSSMRLYKTVDDDLLRVARDLLEVDYADWSSAGPGSGSEVDANDFARLARAEIEHYRAALPDIAADVQVRADITGLMVSRGNLLIGDRLLLRPERVDALLHHEVGTHVLTFYNGRAQPLQQLATGLAGYDELQEGLAVFSEYLAGGLDAARMRVLAARVVAVHAVERGADFIETFRLLHGHGLSSGAAYDITERVHQSGGFTRDLIYLRGLLRLVEHLRGGGALEPLFIGKIAAHHIDILDELRSRGFLAAPPLVPRVFETAGVVERIEEVRRGLPISHMVRQAA
jgi:uncharacterized protein (TIGR02421 family)